MSGFVERVIEDWLTNSDERSYQRSFISVLVRHGHRIRYVSKHSTLEFGKDIVSISPDKHWSAYQLKVGNINLRVWRDIRGEVLELAELPVRTTASGPKRYATRCYLVTTGVIDDTVLEQIRDYNERNRKRDLAEIETVDLHDLIRMFADVFSEFFPATLTFSDLVRLYLSDGTGPLDKRSFADACANLIPEAGGKRRILRSLSHLVVAAEFVSTRFRNAENHVSVMDAWIIAACRIVAIARQTQLRPQDVSPWLEMCHEAIDAAGQALLEELIIREDYFEGSDLLVDLFAVRYRKTIAFGYAAAFLNSRDSSGLRDDAEGLLDVVLRNLPLDVWGEASWNYYLNLAIAMSVLPRGDLVSIGLISSWLTVLCGKQRMEDPYWVVEDALGTTYRGKGGQERVKAFYSLGSAIDFISRRMWRQQLSGLWSQISKCDQAELEPRKIVDQFDWHLDKGTLELHQLPVTGSWSQLRRQSFKQRSSLFGESETWLLPYMLCSYSHRITRKLSGELDYRTASPAFQLDWNAKH